MRTTVHERELKLEVEDRAQLPDLADLSGVAAVTDATTQELVATYFDTPELRLLAHGVTLRRRSGGDDAGWHLKLPAPDGSRDELQDPRAGDDPPSWLVSAAGLYVRDSELTPVAELRTTRTRRWLRGADGTTLAELCDDRVSARAPAPGTLQVAAWREWEVELVDGPVELLAAAADALQRTGARAASGTKLARVLGDRLPTSRCGSEPEPGSVEAVVRARLRRQVAELTYRDSTLRRGQPDAVHKLRVATRRLRSALVTFGPLLDRSRSEPVREELKWLAGVLGPARDIEVMRARLLELLADEPAELVLGPVQAHLRDQLGEELRLAQDRVAQTVRSRRYHDLVDQLDALAAAPPWAERAPGPPTRVLGRRVDKEVRRLRRRAAALPAAPDRAARDRGLHEVRKATKRVRYAAETVCAVHGKDARRLAKAAKRVQTLLGDQHDAVVSQPLLRRLGVAAHLSGGNGFTYGLLLARERGEAERLDREFETLWRRLGGGAVLRRLG